MRTGFLGSPTLATTMGPLDVWTVSSVVDSLNQALFLCAQFLSKEENVHLFSSSLPRFDKCHETSRIFPRTEQTFASARSFGVISWASFSRKNGPFGFGRAPSASQKALSKSKGTFLRENECAKWYQNFSYVKICEGIFVIVCGICQGVDKKGNFQKAHIYEKMNALNDTKTLAMSKSAEGNGEYLWSSVAFVEAWTKSNFPNAKSGLKPGKCCTKIKPALSKKSFS